MIAGSPRHHGDNENLTLTDADLSVNGGSRPYKGGERMRAYCPVHGGDNQRSLEVDLRTGRFHCFNCGCWGYMDWAREEWRRERGLERERSGRSDRRRAVRRPPPPPKPVEPVREDLCELLRGFQEALPGSWGEKYLRHRGVSLGAARAHGLGYAPPGEWPGRGWKGGRLVAPHTDPCGRVINLYGRAVAKGEVPKNLRHDHLVGNKGYFNARVLREGSGPLFVVEGVLDALALIANGRGRTVAIYAARDWRWHWLPDGVRRLVLAFDADETGSEARDNLASEARLRGLEVAYLDRESYGGHGDPAGAFAAGVLDVGEWPPAPLVEGHSGMGSGQPEPWDAELANGLFPEIVGLLDRLAQEAGIDASAVDTLGFSDALEAMQEANEREDLGRLREAAARAREEALRAVAEQDNRHAAKPAPAELPAAAKVPPANPAPQSGSNLKGRLAIRERGSRVALSADDAAVEMSRPGSGPQKTADLYLAGGTKTIEYVVRSVLFALRMDTEDWPRHVAGVEEALRIYGAGRGGGGEE